jgi:hypothetical protein
MKKFVLRSVICSLFIFLFIIYEANTYAQDSSHIRISLLTCTPGEELYSTFGHCAIRIVDSNSVTDAVYNYGTFNFEDEDFYVKFTRGKLLYYISVERFPDFKADYEAMDRGITEQVLNFSAEEKLNIQNLLNDNLREENKYYKYDFFLDNCTTRLRDIIVQSKHPVPQLPPVMPVRTTFRSAIHEYLDRNGQYWSKFGIDILLGVPTDAVMTTEQQQFLPDNLMKALDSTKNTKMVSSSANLYRLPDKKSEIHFFTPLVFTTALFLVFILLGISRNKGLQMVLTGLDGVLFFATGLLGFVIIFMMTGTDHTMTKNNYNILWALPTHLIFSFFVKSEKKIPKIYFLLVSILLVLLLLSWFFLPQQMNNALIPFVLLLLYRSVKIYQYQSL